MWRGAMVVPAAILHRMYAAFFGLERLPFSIAPDPRSLFLSERHREALAHLLYGQAGSGGFVLLTGEVGTGKTTVCRCFLQQIPPECAAAYIFNPKLSAQELLATICDEFGVAHAASDPAHPSIKECVDPLNAWLLAQHAAGRHCVLVIDEAQSLSGDVLEQLRLLTNLETDEKKLLQIILIGQPELRELVARPELTQLAQRVIARYHLGPLTAPETAQYIAHRLAVAGWQGPLPFAPRALARIHALAGGVPRRINLLCDRAMLAAYAAGRREVDAAMVRGAAREVFGAGDARAAWRARWPVALAGAAAGAALVLAVLAVLAAMGRLPGPAAPRGAAAASPQAATPATLAELLVRQPSDEGTAWRRLVRLWGVAAPAQGAPCSAPLPAGLRCWSAQGAAEPLLRQIDRPALLRLQAPGQAPVAVLLLALDGAQAQVQGAHGGPVAVPWPEVARQWTGALATLWRAPEELAADVDVAASDAGRRWLAQQLDRAGAAPAATLRARVQQFQRAQGLQADGQAGPLTLMRLGRVLGADEPRLLARSDPDAAETSPRPPTP